MFTVLLCAVERCGVARDVAHCVFYGRGVRKRNPGWWLGNGERTLSFQGGFFSNFFKGSQGPSYIFLIILIPHFLNQKSKKSNNRHQRPLPHFFCRAIRPSWHGDDFCDFPKCFLSEKVGQSNTNPTSFASIAPCLPSQPSPSCSCASNRKHQHLPLLALAPQSANTNTFPASSCASNPNQLWVPSFRSSTAWSAKLKCAS